MSVSLFRDTKVVVRGGGMELGLGLHWSVGWCGVGFRVYQSDLIVVKASELVSLSGFGVSLPCSSVLVWRDRR